MSIFGKLGGHKSQGSGAGAAATGAARQAQDDAMNQSARARQSQRPAYGTAPMSNSPGASQPSPQQPSPSGCFPQNATSPPPQASAPSRGAAPGQQAPRSRPHNPDRYPWITVPLALAAPPVPGRFPPPFPRYGHSINPIAGKRGEVYLFGGLVAEATMNDLWLFETDIQTGPVRGSLVPTTGEIPSPRVGHGSVLVGDALIVWGGDTLSTPAMNDPSQAEPEIQDDGLYILNLETREWRRINIAGRAPIGRYGHSVGVIDNKFYIFGGQVNGEFFSDLVMFDLQSLHYPHSLAWEFVVSATPPPPRRTGHVSVTHEGKIYIFGGTDGQYHYNDVWSFDLASRVWTELGCIGYHPVPREGHAATIVGDVMYVFGGRGTDGKDLGDLAGFNIPRRRWYAFQSMGPAPSGKSGHAMAAAGQSVFVLGGESFPMDSPDPTRPPPPRDDPKIIHVLRHGKINYPKPEDDKSSAPPSQQQQQRPPANQVRKSSVPDAASSLAYRQPPAQNGTPELQPRATSPQSRIPQPNGLVGAVNGMVYQNGSPVPGQAAAPGTNKRQTGPPQRPRREGDAEFGVPPRMDEEARYERATSPAGVMTRSGQSSPPSQQAAFAATAQQGQRPSPSLRAQRSNENIRGSPALGGAASPPQQYNAASSGGKTATAAAAARSLSPIQRSPEHPPADAFYYPNAARSPLVASSQGHGSDSAELEESRKREQWLRAALALATKNGFIPPESGVESAALEDVAVGEPETEKRRIVEALLKAKQELAKAHATISSQSKLVQEKDAENERIRSAVLQETAFYRAKLAALESGPAGLAGKLDRERAAQLESRLTDLLDDRASLEKRLADVEQAAERHRELRETAEARATEALQRAETAEQAHMRSLDELDELHTKHGEAETSLRDHAVKLTSLTALAAQFESAQASRDEHLSALEQAQAALARANERTKELEEKYFALHGRVADLEADLEQARFDAEAKSREAKAATDQLAELETLWNKAREENESLHVLTSGGLAKLVTARGGSPNGMRDLGSSTNSSYGPQERLRAMEQESGSLRSLLQSAGEKVDETQSALAEQRKRTHELHKQANALRAEITSLRAQLSVAQDAADEARREAASKDTEVRERRRAHTELAVQTSVLRNVIADNGLADDSSAERSGTPTRLRLPELQARLEQQTSVSADLEARLDAVSRARQDAESRVEELSRDLDSARASSAAGVDVEGERALRKRVELAERRAAETEHNSKARVKQVEKDYQQAVEYVKGTEKLVRRLKDELVKAREQNQMLENDLQAATGGRRSVTSPTLQSDAGAMRTQLEQARREADRAINQRDSLQRELDGLQAELQRAADDHARDAASRDAHIDRLADELDRVQRQLDALSSGAGTNQAALQLVRENEDLIAKNEALSARVTTLLETIPETNNRPLSTSTSDSGGYGGAFGDDFSRRRQSELSDYDSPLAHPARYGQASRA